MKQSILILPDSAKVLTHQKVYKEVGLFQPGDAVVYKSITHRHKLHDQQEAIAVVSKVKAAPLLMSYYSIKSDMWPSRIQLAPTHQVLVSSGCHKRVRDLEYSDALVIPAFGGKVPHSHLEYEYGFVNGTVACSGFYPSVGRTVIYFECEATMDKFTNSWIKLYPDIPLSISKPASLFKVALDPNPIFVHHDNLLDSFSGESYLFARGVVDAFKENSVMNANIQLYDLYLWALGTSSLYSHTIDDLDKSNSVVKSSLLLLDAAETSKEQYVCVNNTLLLV